MLFLEQVHKAGYSGDTDPHSGHIDPPTKMMVQRTRFTDKITAFFLNFHLLIQFCMMSEQACLK